MAACVSFAAVLILAGEVRSEILNKSDGREMAVFWPMTEGEGATAHDVGGLGRHLKLNRVAWVEGLHGKAAAFDGSGAWADCSMAGVGGLEEFTVEMWVKLPPNAGAGMKNPMTLISLGSSWDAKSGGFCAFVAGKRLTWTVVVKGEKEYSVSKILPIAAANADWHHYAFVYGKGAVDAYFDGQLLASQTGGGGFVLPFKLDLKIGVYASTPKNFLKGAVGEAGIFRRALAAGDIARLFAEKEKVLWFYPGLSSDQVSRNDVLKIDSRLCRYSGGEKEVRINFLNGAGKEVKQIRCAPRELDSLAIELSGLAPGCHGVEMTLAGMDGGVLSKQSVALRVYDDDALRRDLQRKREQIGTRKLDSLDLSRLPGLANVVQLCLERKDYDRAAVALDKIQWILDGKGEFSLVVLDKDFHEGKLNGYPYNLGATGIFGMPLDAERRESYRQASANRLLTIAPLILHDPEWSAAHPEAGLTYYISSVVVKSTGTECVIQLQEKPVIERLGELPKGSKINTIHPPGEWWHVRDRTANERLSSGDWEYCPESKSVRIKKAVGGHDYQVHYMVDYFLGKLGYLEGTVIDPRDPANVALPCQVGAMANPMLEEYEEYQLGLLEKLMRNWGGYLDVLRVFTTMPYPGVFIGMNGRKEWGQWSWCGYGGGVNPPLQREFERETGLKFDPEWLVWRDNCTGNLAAPPTDGHLAWKAFVRKKMRAWTSKVARLCERYGVLLQFNVGDYWVGLDPYAGDVEEVGFHSVVTYQLNPIKLRYLTDFPGKAKRELKVWLSNFGVKYGDWSQTDECIARLENWWRAEKLSLLGCMVDALRWEVPEVLPMTIKTPGEKERAFAALKKISAEFLDYRSKLLGQEVFKFPIVLYVLDGWGRESSWAAWGDEFGTPSAGRIEDCLCGLPFRIKFVSLREISRTGVPSDCDVLLNFGEQNTSTSGGMLWKLPGVIEKIGEYVRKGGGFAGIGSPACVDNRFLLGKTLGIEFGKEQAGEVTVRKTAAGKGHWICEGLGDEVKGAGGTSVQVAAGERLFEKQGDAGDWRGIVVRDQEGGRAGYLGLYGNSWEYKALLERMIFWLARKEAEFDRFQVSIPQTHGYLYPAKKLLIVHNESAVERKTRVKLDPALIGLPGKGAVVLTWGEAGEKSETLDAGRLKSGFDLALKPCETRFVSLQLKKVD